MNDGRKRTGVRATALAGAATVVAAVGYAVFHVPPGRARPDAGPAAAGATTDSRAADPPEPAGDPGGSPPASTPAWQADADVHALVERGWDEAAARSVVVFHAELFKWLHAEAPADHRDAIRRLGRLGGRDNGLARARLIQLPELAALMANAAEIDATAPNRLAAVIRNDPDAATLIGMFTLSAEPRDAVRLCGLLEVDRQLLLGLAERDSIDLACWLEPTDIDPAAAGVYRRWVSEMLRRSLWDGSGETLDRTALLLTIHADAVAGLLDGDPAFRDAFTANLAPRFEKLIACVEDDGFQRQAFLIDPRIWVFLHRHPLHAEEMIGRVGPLAVDVLLDPRFHDVEPQIIGLLRHADTAVVDGLLDERVRDNPRFIDFLQRPIDDETRARGLRALAAAPDEAGNLLAYWATLDQTALEEDMADPPAGLVTMLPGYASVALLRKAAQGRTVTMWDVGMAGLDAVETFMLVKGGGATLKMVGAKARSAAARSMGRTTAERLGRETAQEGVELLPWMLEAGHGAVRRAVAEVRDRLVIDATPVVRGMYSKSGVGRDTFKVLDGLDARIFMRRDRRVVIDLAGDHPLGRYLRETAKKAGRAAATDGDPTEGLLVETADAVVAARENTSTWWLGNGDGVFTRQAREKSRP